MSDERRWAIKICPVHGHKLHDGIKCIEVVGRDEEGTAIFCHESQEVEVVPREVLRGVEAERDELQAKVDKAAELLDRFVATLAPADQRRIHAALGEMDR